MGDQAEKVILEAEDQVTPVVNKANAGLDSFEKKAESSHGKVIRISDQTRSSVQRLIASLEKQAETYGKSGVERLIAQRDQLLQRYSREPQAIDAITKSYERMIATQKKIDTEAKFEGFGEKIKQGIENPLSAAQGVLSRVTASMGPFGVAIAAGIATLTGLAVAGFEAAKGLGEYGTRIKDVELRTGLTAREVGQFGFAAKVAGQDVSIFERMMKGLSQAADDTSKEGEKARTTLRNMGVDMHDTFGAMKPTSQILEEVSEGLAKMPNALERDAAAMALFKRAGVEAIPVITELSENLQIARAKGYGPSEEEVGRFKRYQQEIVEIETSWARLARQLKEPLAGTILFTVKVAGALWNLAQLPGQIIGQKLFGGTPTATDLEMQDTGGWGYGGSMSRRAHSQELAGIARNDTAVAAARVLDQNNKQLELAEKKLADLQTELKTGVMPSVNEPTLQKIAEQRQVVAGIKAQIEASKQLKDWQHQASEFEKKGDEAELSALEKIYHQRDLLLKQGEKLKASEADVAAIHKAADQQASVEAKKITEAFRGEVTKETNEQWKERWNLGLMGGPNKEQIKVWEEGFSADREIEKIGFEAQRDQLRRRAARAGRMAELTAPTEEQAANQAYKIRLDLAVELAGIEAERIAKEENAGKKSVLAAQAEKDLYTQIAEAQDQFDEKQAQLQQRRAQDLQKQVDDLQKTSEGLFHTLFARPRDFSRQLGDTVHEAVLKPITEGLGNLTARVLQPIIHGPDGKGGIAGIFGGLFGGKQDPVKLSTDQNTAATLQNSAVMAGLTAILAAAMGMATPTIPSVGGVGAIPGLAVAAISAPATSGGGVPFGVGLGNGFGVTSGGTASFSPMGWGAGAPAGWTGLESVLGGPGGTSGYAGPVGGGGILSRMGLGTAAGRMQMLEAGSTTAGSALLMAGLHNRNAGMSVLGGTGLGFGLAQQMGMTGYGGAITGAGAGLAMAGLQRGGWGGVGMSTAGGALVGLQFGGPIGAAIGAAVGFTAGMIRKFGFESLEETAHKDIKQVYGVDIPKNSGVIKQIVDMAKQQFGGSISMAVRSPSVRELVMLYSEATGQKMPLSATTPRAGSLVEQNGGLFQAPSFQNGTPYYLPSSIPTVANLPGASTYPTPGGGPINLALHVDGQGLAPFMTGNYVTPEFVQDQAMAAQNSSYNRTQQAANMQQPGLVVG